MYRRMIARFVILGSFVMGTLFLAQPAYADECLAQCQPVFQDCTVSGGTNCRQLYDQCLCQCRGKC